MHFGLEKMKRKDEWWNDRFLFIWITNRNGMKINGNELKGLVYLFYTVNKSLNQ